MCVKNESKLNLIENKSNNLCKERDGTYITAATILSTAQNANKNMPGPSKPIVVINLLTDNTVHRRLTNVSAKWPETASTIKMSHYVVLEVE